MLRIQGYTLSIFFTALSIAMAVLSCGPDGQVVNQAEMNFAVLLLVPAMIAYLAATLCTERRA